MNLKHALQICNLWHARLRGTIGAQKTTQRHFHLRNSKLGFPYPVKNLLALFLLALPSCVAEEAAVGKPAYVSEAPLPKGWPTPGPYNQISEKNYPEYRAAVTNGSSGFSFWTLFNHIKKKDIPMTAPVEMKMEDKGNKLKKVNMAFLYQDTGVGTTGADGKKIEVKDIKPSKVLSYSWMGDDSNAQVKKAKEALESALKKKGVEAASYRMLGYNGPGTPRKKHTYALQAILPSK